MRMSERKKNCVVCISYTNIYSTFNLLFFFFYFSFLHLISLLNSVFEYGCKCEEHFVSYKNVENILYRRCRCRARYFIWCKKRSALTARECMNQTSKKKKKKLYRERNTEQQKQHSQCIGRLFKFCFFFLLFIPIFSHRCSFA